MSTIWIVVIVAVLLLVVFVLRHTAKMGRAMQLADPLSSVTKNGFLGFVLGDTYRFVWQRAVSLGLMTKEEMEEEKEDLKLTKMFGVGSNSIHAAKNKFDEIKSITFCFDNVNRLNSILVYVKDKANATKREYMKEIRDKYSKLLGNPQVDAGMTYQWLFNGSSVTMFYDKENIIINIMSL